MLNKRILTIILASSITIGTICSEVCADEIIMGDDVAEVIESNLDEAEIEEDTASEIEEELIIPAEEGCPMYIPYISSYLKFKSTTLTLPYNGDGKYYSGLEKNTIAGNTKNVYCIEYDVYSDKECTKIYTSGDAYASDVILKELPEIEDRDKLTVYYPNIRDMDIDKEQCSLHLKAGKYYVKAFVLSDYPFKAKTTKNALELTIAKASFAYRLKVTNTVFKESDLKQNYKNIPTTIATSCKGCDDNVNTKKTFEKISGSKYIVVSSDQRKIRIKKNTPKGTYSAKIKVKVPTQKNYKGKTITTTVKVTVK